MYFEEEGTNTNNFGSSTKTPDSTPQVNDGGGFGGWLLLGVLVVLLAGLAIFFFWRRRKILRASLVYRNLDMVYLEILVPREGSQDQFGQEATKQNEKELIGIAEQLYTTLYFPPASVWKTFWRGPDVLSFEIVGYDKKIHFYIVCPRTFQNNIERQLTAQYPKAVIDEVEPYKFFAKGNELAVTEMVLQKDYIYPIRTYEQQNSDPLNAITNAMSKMVVGESIALQVVVTPAHPTWGNHLRKLAEEVHNGKHPKELGKTTWEKFSKDIIGSSSKGEDNGLPKSLTPMQQEIVKSFEDKASRPGYYTNVRLLCSSDSKQAAETHLNTLLSAFAQYTMAPFNGFKTGDKNPQQLARDFLLRSYNDRNMLLNTQELASIWHLPTRFTETPNINWLTFKKAPAPVNTPEEGILLGLNEFRGVTKEIRILEEDRMRHTYVIGGSGTGKTEIMKNMVAQDIAAGRGVCVIDPHGDFVEDILPIIPKERAEDVIIFDPSDMERPFGLNMLDVNMESQKDFAVQEMISVFYALFPPDYLGPMFEHYMRNVMLTLIADIKDPGTLVEIPRMFTDKAFQDKYVSRVRDPNVRAFWQDEMSKTDFAKGGGEMLGYLISKIGRFIENDMMRNIIGQQRSSFDFRDVMDNRKILLVNLSKGKIGEINAKLLGLIIVSKLLMAALSRANTAGAERQDFYLYVDEFQNFITDAFAIILSEARKYRLGLTVAHQFLDQLAAAKPGSSGKDDSVRSAIFGNVGTKIVFRVGVEDAEIFAKELAPVFSEYDVINIERYNAYVKLMVNNTVSKPFSMKTLPLPKGDPQLAQAIKELSRLKHGRLRSKVEAEIMDRSQMDKFLKPSREDLLGKLA